MKNYKTILNFTFQSEYAVLKLLLDQYEVRYIFLHETMIGILPFHSNKNGGIKLQVHEDDLELANKIINDFQSSSNLKTV